ncbi:spindle apparatus coiled-coil protein 1 spindly isoform X2 [Halictus rubicundus]|uniref:spindle apparatus coiled-coil protein 1 spindly isoform X2 n=1 Tax=Halictus rubicundus TaxID=77578 RepID=UPI004035D63B
MRKCRRSDRRTKSSMQSISTGFSDPAQEIQKDTYVLYRQDLKEQLHKKSSDLEEARAAFALNRTEAVSLDLDIDPTNDLSKGNSLFAEIEDRRRDMVNKMNALHRKYTEVKRTCALQMAEIKMLKKERVSTLSEWENDAGNVSAEMEELLQKYKSRVSDLERKLKSEIKKNEQSDQENVESATFAYYQSLVFAKKKEVDELRVKIEDLSTHLLVQEETKMNMSKQLRYSQYKISSLEAQLQVLQGESKLSRGEEDNANTETRLKEFQDFARVDNNNVTVAETRLVSAQQQGSTVFVLQDNKGNDIISDSMDTSREAGKPKRIETDDGDKNTCPAKTVQFSKNIVYIPTNANI